MRRKAAATEENGKPQRRPGKAGARARRKRRELTAQSTRSERRGERVLGCRRTAAGACTVSVGANKEERVPWKAFCVAAMGRKGKSLARVERECPEEWYRDYGSALARRARCRVDPVGAVLCLWEGEKTGRRHRHASEKRRHGRHAKPRMWKCKEVARYEWGSRRKKIAAAHESGTQDTCSITSHLLAEAHCAPGAFVQTRWRRLRLRASGPLHAGSHWRSAAYCTPCPCSIRKCTGNSSPAECLLRIFFVFLCALVAHGAIELLQVQPKVDGSRSVPLCSLLFF